MSNRAWVTLATNDSYGLGALVVAHSLRRSGSIYPAVVLITPSVTEAMSERLRAVFAEVVVVDVLDSRDAAHLALLQRPELGITFTKIHCWNLTQYEKCVFLDADTLIVQNCDDLFEREELSAAPDVGWPDCFNSGVFVFKPSAETFSNLISFATERGSFDGGDQGLLNSYFSDWAQGDANKRLPFLYNVTSAAFYSYLPALKHYGQNLKIIHFIGTSKPWLQPYNWQSGSVEAPSHLQGFLQLWWDIFVGQVHSQLDTAMEEVVEDPEAMLREETDENLEPIMNYSFYEPKLDPLSEFPWHHPNKQVDVDVTVPEIDLSQFHDPWDIYRGNIPVNTEEKEKIDKTSEDYHDVRKSAWDYTYSQQNIYDSDNQNAQYFKDIRTQILEPRNDEQLFNIESSFNSNHTNIGTDHDTNSQHHFENTHTSSQYNHNSISTILHSHPENITQESHYNQLDSESTQHNTHTSAEAENESQLDHYILNHIYNLNTSTPRKGIGHVYTVMMDHVRINHSLPENKVNGYESDSDSDIDEDITPRHPYDGFYLRHRTTIDSHGHKICSHDIPLQPPSTPSENSDQFEDALETLTEEITYMAVNGDKSHTGVAGNLARVVPGAPTQQEAVNELARRQGWEAGNIDYMGADSFDNIWAKISHTLSQPPSSASEQQATSKEESQPETTSEPTSVPVSIEEAKEAIEASSGEEAVALTTEAEPIAPSSELVETSSDLIVKDPIEKMAEVPPEQAEGVPSTTAVEVTTEQTVEIPPTKPAEVTPEQTVEISATKTVEITQEQTEEVPSTKTVEVTPEQTAEVPSTKTVEVTPEQIAEVPSTKTVEVTPEQTVDIPPVQVEILPEQAVTTSSEPVVDVVPEQPTEVIPEQAIEVPEQQVEVPAEKAVEAPVETVAEEAPIKKDAVETQDEKKAEEAAVKLAETVPVTSEESTETPVPVPDQPASDAPEVPAGTSETTDAPGKIEEIIPVPVEAAAVDLAATAESVASDAKQTEPEATEVPVAVEALKIDDVPVPVSAPEIEKVLTDQSVSAPVTSIPEPTPAEESKVAESSEKLEVVSDSPPLANTPSKEEIPAVPAAKSEERRKPAGKLQLRPPQAADPVLTPDTELEDAAALAQSIIASELPESTSASPASAPSPSHTPASDSRLSVQEPAVPAPPAGSVSLSQIGVKPKPSTAAQIESSVSAKTGSAPSTPDAPKTADPPKAADAPKKKIVKKVIKKDKEGASSGEAPVPPPRKKEKKPKEK